MLRNEKYQRNGVVPVVPLHLNYGKHLLSQFLLWKDAIALINGSTDEKMTFREMCQYAVNLASALVELGAKVGDVVAICSEKRNELIPILLGAVLSGAAYTPFDDKVGRAGLKYKLELVRPKFIIITKYFWNEYKDVFNNINIIALFIMVDDVDTEPITIKSLVLRNVNIDQYEPPNVKGQTDIALILYSSGSTGTPKGVPMSHLTCIAHSQIGKFEDPAYKTLICSGEWCHSYDNFTTFHFLSAGKTVVYYDGPCESFLQCIQDYQANVAFIVPSLTHSLIELDDIEKFNVDSLKYIYCATNALDSRIREKFVTRYPKVEYFVQGYGMTETFELTSERWGTPGLKKDTVGKASPGVTLKVVDINTGMLLGPNQRGELWIYSASMIDWYIGADISSCFDEEGFMKTGDLGYYDEDGYFFIVDRIKEIIYYDGFQVPPMELEAILLLHPHVNDAGIVGKSVAGFGEVPVAFVVPKPGTGVVEKDLLDYVNKEVATHMQLRGGLFFVNEIPRNNIGKIIRPALKEMMNKIIK